jgi:hypothetical protein
MDRSFSFDDFGSLVMDLLMAQFERPYFRSRLRSRCARRRQTTSGREKQPNSAPDCFETLLGFRERRRPCGGSNELRRCQCGHSLFGPGTYCA